MIVDLCDQSYGLNGFEEQRYLCGIWHESETDWNDSGIDSLVLSLVPGRLCTPEMGEKCKDIILDIGGLQSTSPEEIADPEIEDEVLEEDSNRLPGFSVEILFLSIIFAMIYVRRKW